METSIATASAKSRQSTGCTGFGHCETAIGKEVGMVIHSHKNEEHRFTILLPSNLAWTLSRKFPSVLTFLILNLGHNQLVG